MTDDNSDIARALIRRGYFIIPLGIGSKRPLEEGWENKPMSEMHVARFRRHGIGVLCGYGGPYLWAVDLDIYDESLVTRLERFCERFGATVVRQGAAPKLLLVFQTAEPMRKMTSRAYRYGDKMCRIEALGAGQQFAAYGRHPDTGQDYQWLDMLGGLKEIDAKDLPVITAADVQTLFSEFYTIATEKGWPLWKREKAGNTGVSAEVDPDDPFTNARTGESLETVAVWANTVDCSDYDDWLNLGMALHHEYVGTASEHAALALWDDVSQRFPNYRDHDDLVKRWDSFTGGSKPRQVTVRSLAKSWREATAEVKEAAVEAAEPPPVPGKRPRFYPVPASEFADAPPMSWWVKGVLPQAEVAIVFGESGSGKSFFTLDLALHVAIGMPWRGLKVRQGRVVVIAAEGAAGTRQRLRAYQEHSGHSLEGIPLAIIADTPNLMEAHHKLIAKQVVETGGAALIVVDTLAASTIGANENSGEDMGKALAACKALHKATGALVVLIHHAGKDASKGARGWSGLRAAVDAEIEVVREGDQRVATLTKQKDGQDGQRWGFALEPVAVGVDEDGDPVTSCAVVEADLPAAAGTGTARRMGSRQRMALAVVQEMCGAGATDVATEDVLDAILARLPAGGDPKGNRRTNYRATLDQMVEDGYLSVQEGRISLPE